MRFFLLTSFMLLMDSSLQAAQQVIMLDTVLLVDQDVDQVEETPREVLEQIEYFKRNKLDINRATATEIRSLPLLSMIEAQEIILLRKERKKITYLGLVSILGEEKTREVLHIIEIRKETSEVPEFLQYLQNNKLLETIQFEWRSRAYYKFPIPRGYLDSTYAGSPIGSYHRIQAQMADNFFLSALIEKDAGEASYIDFASISLQVSNIFYLKRLVLGDYNLRFGQGLVLRTGRLFFKSIELPMGGGKSGDPLQLYTSSQEANFQRGVGLEMVYDIAKVIFFYSNHGSDATLTKNGEFSSIAQSGLHRTMSEIDKKEKINEILYGGRFTLAESFGWVSVEGSFNVVRTQYSGIYKKSETLYYAPSFSGDVATNISFDYKVWIGKINFYGEIAYLAENRSLSGIGGIVADMGGNVEAETLFRYYPPDYYAPKPSAFSESAVNASNEAGFFVSLSLRPIKALKLKSYVDIFWRLHPTRSSTSRSIGRDIQIRADWKFSKQISTTFSFQNKSKDENVAVDGIAKSEYKKNHHSGYWRLRLELLCLPVREILYKTRGEVKFFSGLSSSFGWLFYQEIKMKLFDNKIRLLMRATVFQTDSFASAIYVYQPRVSFISRAAASHGTGYRFLVNATVKVLSALEVGLSYLFLSRSDVDRLGSGSNSIPSNAEHSLWATLVVSL